MLSIFVNLQEYPDLGNDNDKSQKLSNEIDL